MPRKQTSIYPGKLDTPIPKPASLGLLGAPPDPDWEREYRERFLLLVGYYQLDVSRPDFWPALALNLMGDHVPAFGKPRKPPGRPRTNDSNDARNLRAELLRRVDQSKAKNPALSDKAACKYVHEQLMRHEPNHRWSKRAVNTLRLTDLSLARREQRIKRNMLVFYLAAAKEGSPPFNFESDPLLGLAPLGSDKPLTLKSLANPADLLKPPQLPENSDPISKQK